VIKKGVPQLHGLGKKLEHCPCHEWMIVIMPVEIPGIEQVIGFIYTQWQEDNQSQFYQDGYR
jgi:hypothetical protein